MSDSQKKQLRWEVLKLLAAAHPGTLSQDKLFGHLREIDSEWTRTELLSGLSVLSRHELLQSFPPDALQGWRYRITAKGREAIEAGQGC